LTVTVERIDGGKLRCTGATWSDAVVIYPGEALAFVNIERDAVRCAIEMQNGMVELNAGQSPERFRIAI
jgi:hypothetical protein